MRFIQIFSTWLKTDKITKKPCPQRSATTAPSRRRWPNLPATDRTILCGSDAGGERTAATVHHISIQHDTQKRRWNETQSDVNPEPMLNHTFTDVPAPLETTMSQIQMQRTVQHW